MLTLTLLSIISVIFILVLIILAVFTVIVLSTLGAGFVVVFGDVIVCGFIIGLVIKKICKKRKELKESKKK